jgi:hypothetical protein
MIVQTEENHEELRLAGCSTEIQTRIPLPVYIAKLVTIVFIVHLFLYWRYNLGAS